MTPKARRRRFIVCVVEAIMRMGIIFAAILLYGWFALWLLEVL